MKVEKSFKFNNRKNPRYMLSQDTAISYNLYSSTINNKVYSKAKYALC